MIAIPVTPNPVFYGDVGNLLPNNKLDLRSTKYKQARLRGCRVNAIPKGWVAIVRWGTLTEKKRKELGGSFDDAAWVWIVPAKAGN